MGFVKEFKEFAVKGNVMDMAVGVIIGGAFGKIVSSLVDDILMPLIGKATGGVSFTDLFVNLGDGTYNTLAEAKEAGAAVFAYGQFIQNIIDFIIIAFCVFLMIINFTLGMILTNQSGAAMRTLINNRMLDISNTAAAMLDGDMLEVLQADDKDSPAYQAVLKTLTYYQENIDLSYIV